MIQYVLREKSRTRTMIDELLNSSSWPVDDPAAKIQRDASSIANAMAMIHGGEWRIQIDHQTGYVLVRRN